MPAPKPNLELVEITPPAPTELSAEQREVFKYSDEAAKRVGTDRLRPVRLGAGLIGYHYNPHGTPPPEYAAVLKHVAEAWVIVYREGTVATFPLVPKHEFAALIPAPSGNRFLVFSKKGPSTDDPDAEVGGGHVVEVDARTLAASVAFTGTTGRSGSFLGTNARDVRTVWTADYVDDDTIVTSISENNSTEHSIVLLGRGADGTFAEIDRTKAPANGTILTAGAGVIAVSSGAKLVAYGVLERKLVKLGTVAKPAKFGPVVAHPVDTREELHFIDKAGSKHYRLTNHDLLLAATKPKKKKKA
ncbi:MAG: hypothetical protein AB7T06_38385 [Kofleriaceae bacterium]